MNKVSHDFWWTSPIPNIDNIDYCRGNLFACLAAMARFAYFANPEEIPWRFLPWRFTEIAACKLRNVPAEELLEGQLQFKDAFLEIPSVDSLSTAYLLRINIQETLEHYMEAKKDSPKLGVEEFFAGICGQAYEKRRTKETPLAWEYAFA